MRTTLYSLLLSLVSCSSVASASSGTSAFASVRLLHRKSSIKIKNTDQQLTLTTLQLQDYPSITNNFNRHSTTTALRASTGDGALGLAKHTSISALLAQVLSRVRRHANILLLLLVATTTAAILLSKRSNPQTLLWPGTHSDDSQYLQDTPLPPGSLGCPFLGHDIFGGSKEYGPFVGLAKLSQKFDGIFKVYSFGLPIVSVAGVDNIKSLLKQEFQKRDGSSDDGGSGINTFVMGKKNLGPIFGEEALLYEHDAAKHGKLRRLVGSAMTPAAIEAAIPSIQEAAGKQIENILEAGEGTIEMEKVFNDYTLDIAWKQILGLDLREEEVPRFHKAVADWTGGILNPMLLLPFRIPGLMKFSKIGRARTYLTSKVEEKLAKLERDGPDNSTLSKLYFATDDDDGTTRLTHAQVMHNALFLIFAGSETSSSTLTCVSLLLGLHPKVWKKIQEEQRELCSEEGEGLTRKILDKCTYLDSVVKETLRLHPVETLELRRAAKTVVVDGKQIPEGWMALGNIKETHRRDPTVYQEDGSHMDDRKGFEPERWLEESAKPSVWMPFGDGPRRCIGERLAMTEMKVFLAMLARKVDYELVANDEKIAWKTNTVMARPADGVEVRARVAVA
eukprot:CAMPEP_0196132764 /NCGR_PEP_ID=MMETSP0910-20130528/2253_1 /TAXON_ID=49265 /ORGANISM="Thalassiosira rotula, Strain GSO102" /LENGTH=619 /DNA_ID=CAMNT_0041392401 /DNA_START=20 /DNA_END=1879 /DNA_ORIENTATION=-